MKYIMRVELELPTDEEGSLTDEGWAIYTDLQNAIEEKLNFKEIQRVRMPILAENLHIGLCRGN